jgi:hypothetical protein
MYSENWIYTLRWTREVRGKQGDGEKGLRDQDVEGLKKKYVRNKGSR